MNKSLRARHVVNLLHRTATPVPVALLQLPDPIKIAKNEPARQLQSLLCACAEWRIAEESLTALS
jgi:hypothetical protein